MNSTNLTSDMQSVKPDENQGAVNEASDFDVEFSKWLDGKPDCTPVF
jgi:hypothetical protein